MFGLLDVGFCTLGRDRKRFYSCGVCDAIAHKYGRHCRRLLTNDAVYLSLLMAAQRNEIHHEDLKLDRRCRPWAKSTASSSDFDYPAAVSIYLSGVRLLDDMFDSGSLRAKILFAFHRSRIKKAENELRKLGLELPSVGILVSHQHMREKVIGCHYDWYSQLSEEIYSKVFSHTARLTGKSGNVEDLANVGLQVGRIAYLLDSYTDFSRDSSQGQFNAYSASYLLDEDSKKPSGRFLKDQIDRSLKSIRDSISRVGLFRFQETIKHTVTDGLNSKVQMIIGGARGFASRPVLYSLAPYIVLSALNTLTTSSSSDYCCEGDCCEGYCCDGSTSHRTPSPSPSLRPPTTIEVPTNVGEAVKDGTIGAVAGGGGIAVSEILSRTRRSVSSTDSTGEPLEEIEGPRKETEEERTPHPPEFSEWPPPPPPPEKVPDPAQQRAQEERAQRRRQEYLEDQEADKARERRGIDIDQEYRELCEQRPGFMERFDRTLWETRPERRYFNPESDPELVDYMKKTKRLTTLLNKNQINSLTPEERKLYEDYKKKMDSLFRRRSRGMGQRKPTPAERYRYWYEQHEAPPQWRDDPAARA